MAHQFFPFPACDPGLMASLRTARGLVALALVGGWAVDGAALVGNSGVCGPRCAARRGVRAPAPRAQEEEEEDLSVSHAGVPQPALADRDGPFWTTLGEPNARTGARPDFLRRDDWHISSTYTDEQRNDAEAAAVADALASSDAREKALAEEEESPAAKGADMELVDYMIFEEDDLDPERERRTSKAKMPSNWQEFQFLQDSMRAHAEGAEAEADRAEAASIASELDAFYESFKVVLAEGWTLDFDPSVDRAATFLLNMKGK